MSQQTKTIVEVRCDHCHNGPKAEYVHFPYGTKLHVGSHWMEITDENDKVTRPAETGGKDICLPCIPEWISKKRREVDR